MNAIVLIAWVSLLIFPLQEWQAVGVHLRLPTCNITYSPKEG
jgi:hypothetical protein